MRAKYIAITCALCTTLSACGDTAGEQALYGAGAGFLGATVLDGNVYTGAAAGAAANVIYCQQNPGRCS